MNIYSKTGPFISDIHKILNANLSVMSANMYSYYTFLTGTQRLFSVKYLFEEAHIA